MHSPSPLVMALSTSLAIVAPSFARSQAAEQTAEPEPPPLVQEGRTLNGHTFMPAAEVRWPFTVTSFASDLVIAYGSSTASLQIGDRTFAGTMNYAGIGGVIGFEYAFLPIFSARAVLDDIVYSGIDGKSAISVGTEMQVGFGIGLTAALPIDEKTRFAFLFDVDARPNLALTIAEGLREILATCEQPSGCTVEPGTIFGSTRVVNVRPAIAVSWAPMPPLGVTANLTYRYSSSSGPQPQNGSAIVLGAYADWDFAEASKVPIGLQLQLSWTAPFASTGLQDVFDLGGGVFYTGKKELAAGIQLIARRYAVSPNLNVSWSTYLATLGLRYFW